MAVTLREEVSEKLTGFGVACGFRFFCGQECSEVNAHAIQANVCDESAGVFPFGNPTMAAGIVALKASVFRVLGLRAYTEITATVIKTVAVDVVNDSLWISHAENKAVHENIALSALRTVTPEFSVYAADGSNSVERISAFAEFAGLPLEIENKISIGIVNDGDLTLSELNFHDDCSLSNTLCSVAAPCKVQGFGDQPSRDVDIVGASWQ